MSHLLEAMVERVTTLREDETGAAGWLILGVILGVLLVIFLIIKFLIPGE